MPAHVRTHRFEVSNYRPAKLAHPAWLQDGRLTLPQCFNLVRFGDVNGDGQVEMILHEWNDNFTRTECVIFENTRAKGQGKPFDQLEMAIQTVY